jgi:hypothetical protein
MKTWKEMAEEAYQVQDACNLSGVVHSFSRIISDVRARLELEGRCGTEEVNKHPVCILFADKIAHLTGTQLSDSVLRDAYKWVGGYLND